MSPPELPGDAPVVDVVHPFKIGLGPVGGDEFNLPLFDHTNSFLGQGFHTNEPLPGQMRLYDGLAAVAVPDCMLVILCLFKKSHLFEPGNNLFAALKPVQSLELLARFSGHFS
ncbi:hypothetical protein ES703_52205 [subsurface metagenome]